MNVSFSLWILSLKMPFSINFVPIGEKSCPNGIALIFAMASELCLPYREQDMSDRRLSSHRLESLLKLRTEGDGTVCRRRHRKIAHVSGVLESHKYQNSKVLTQNKEGSAPRMFVQHWQLP
jgi:hypothetical protein